ncbi:hypothetical protein ACWPM1_02520 [Tsuneonella sp. HG249]
MIRGSTRPATARFIAGLAAKAKRVAEARMRARQDDRRWREPGLLWPLFGDR